MSSLKRLYFRVSWNPNLTFQAVKVLKKSHPRDKMKLLRKNYQRETEAGRQPLNSTINNIRKEIATMARCRHANIARLVEVINDSQHDKIYMSKFHEIMTLAQMSDLSGT